jgi:hypothetical protein
MYDFGIERVTRSFPQLRKSGIFYVSDRCLVFNEIVADISVQLFEALKFANPDIEDVEHGHSVPDFDVVWASFLNDKKDQKKDQKKVPEEVKEEKNKENDNWNLDGLLQ